MEFEKASAMSMADEAGPMSLQVGGSHWPNLQLRAPPLEAPSTHTDPTMFYANNTLVPPPGWYHVTCSINFVPTQFGMEGAGVGSLQGSVQGSVISPIEWLSTHSHMSIRGGRGTSHSQVPLQSDDSTPFFGTSKSLMGPDLFFADNTKIRWMSWL
jgi:hypothetical protein